MEPQGNSAKNQPMGVPKRSYSLDRQSDSGKSLIVCRPS